MSAIIVLGAGGFVGAHLINSLSLGSNPSSPSEYFTYDRSMRKVRVLDIKDSKFDQGLKEMTLDVFVQRFRKVTIVNLMTNPREASLDIVREANYSIPNSLLNDFISNKNEISWIQVNSYFQFYFSVYGVDKDEYSRQKRLFNDNLLRLSDNSMMSVTQVYSPHLYGNLENSNRITKKLRDLVQGQLKQLYVSSGRQYLPLLDVRAFVSVISDLVSASTSYRGNSAIYVRPEMTHKLRYLCNLAASLLKDGKEKITYYKETERPNEFYEPIFAPSELLQYDSKLSFKFLDYLSSKD